MKKGTQTASLFSFRKARITEKGEDVMKKTTVTITFDEEKLSALKIYLEQKNQTAEEELEAALAALYNKTVPTGGERVSRSAFGYNAARSKIEANETFILFCRGRIRWGIRYGRKRKRGGSK